MHKYHFSKKYDWWNKDHLENFQYVKKVFENCPGLNFLEIGVFEGRTTTWLLDNVLIRDNCRIHCIDVQITKKGVYNLCQHQDKVSLYIDSSESVLSQLLYKKQTKFDFIYVDGDHNAYSVLQDLVWSWKLLKIGGILLIDDYEMEIRDPWFYISHKEFSVHPRLNFTHPKVAIDAFLNIYRGQYEKIIDNYQIGVKKILTL